MKAHSEERIAYLAALSILFSAAELFIPKPLPFFRLGLANIPILISLDMPIRDFMVLLLLKAAASSYISGNLFSPFLLLSAAQTIIAGLVMKLIGKLGSRWISRYGISAAGALSSAAVQLAFTSAYLGPAVLSYTPLMLILSLLSSILTACISYRIDIPESPDITRKASSGSRGSDKMAITMLAVSSIALLMTADARAALISFIIAIIMQRLSHRRIMPAPYISITAFMLLTSMLAPEGEIIWQLGPLKAGTASLQNAFIKAMHISGTVALSQCYTGQLGFSGGILSLTLEYSAALLDIFNSQSGPLSKRLSAALSLKHAETEERSVHTMPKHLSVISAISFVAISCISFII